MQNILLQWPMRVHFIVPTCTAFLWDNFALQKKLKIEVHKHFFIFARISTNIALMKFPPIMLIYVRIDRFCVC